MYMWFLLLSKIVKDTFRNKFGWLLSPFHRKVFKCHKNVCFNTLYFRSSRLQMFHEIGSPKNFSKYTGTHFCKSILFREVSIYSLQLYEKKETHKQEFFHDLCDIFENTNFVEDLRMNASVFLLTVSSKTYFEFEG